METLLKYDLNSDGVLDKTEIRSLLNQHGYQNDLADFVVEDMIRSIDLDGNGVIELDEFDALLARNRRQRNKQQ